MTDNLDRRTFLQRGAALAGLAGACLLSSPETEARESSDNVDTAAFKGLKVIDVHSHYLSPGYRKALLRHGQAGKESDGLPAPAWSEEAHLQSLEKYGIASAWISLASPHPHWGDKLEAAETVREFNEFGAGLVKRNGRSFVLFATLPLPDIDEALKELEYCRKNLPLGGFKLPSSALGHYPGDSAYEPVLKRLNELKAIVLLHPNAPRFPAAVPECPLAVVEYMTETTKAVANMALQGVLKRYKDIRWVIPHGGALLPSLVDRLAGMQGLISAYKGSKVEGLREDLRSLYYDLAGFPCPGQLAGLLQMTSPDHLLYGSDYPYAFEAYIAENREKLLNIPLLSAGNLKNILRHNAEGLPSA